MEFSPQKLREIVLQMLFSFELNGTDDDEIISLLMKELEVSKKNVRAAYEKALAIWAVKDCLDQKIAAQSQNYAFDRIESVEKSVLRLAFYELLNEKDKNEKIIISEACRLTTKFSAPEAAAFVNAILDTLKTDDGSSLCALQTETAS